MMMKVKLILPFILLGMMVFSNMSCSDFFNQVPDDMLTIEQVFQRRQYSEEYLANVYNYIPDESHRTSPIPWDPCSDDLDVTYDRPDYNSYKMNLGNWNASSNYYEFWSKFYKGIRSATYFMQHIGENTEILELPNGEDLIKQYIAEARFLRAFFYYNLLRQYGPVVIIGDEVIPGDLPPTSAEMTLPRSSYEECVDYIVSELDLAAQDLPLHFTEQADNDYGRATQLMCMAIKSRTLLLAASPQFNGNDNYVDFKNKDGKQLVNITYDVKKWKRAADAALDIIKTGQCDLFKVYDKEGKIDPYLSCRNVFLEAWNDEVIFARNNNSLGAWERSATPRLANGYESMGATQQLVDEFEMANGKMINESGSGYVETGFSTVATAYCPKGVYNMYVNREPRFYVNIAYNGAPWMNTSEGQKIIQLYFTGNSGKKGSWDFPRTGYIAIKNVHPNSNPRINQYIKRPYLIVRYTEILLNYIEALNECDPTHPDILKYLNQIRERAGVALIGTGLNQQEMRRRIRHERRVELCFEQLRYFDTRRWLIAEQTDGGPFYGMNMDAGNSLTDEEFYKRTVFETRVFKKNYYLFPIPQSELDRNINMVQNPGW